MAAIDLFSFYQGLYSIFLIPSDCGYHELFLNLTIRFLSACLEHEFNVVFAYKKKRFHVYYVGALNSFYESI